MSAARQPLPEPTELVADGWCDAESLSGAVAQEIEHPAKVFVVRPARTGRLQTLARR